MALPASAKQIPDHAILDVFNKQTYLGNQYNVNLASTVGASEIPILLLSNAQLSNGNSIGLFQNLLQVVSQTSSQTVILKIYANPTVSSVGNPITPINSRIAYGVTNSVALVSSAPSVSAKGTLIGILTAQDFIMGKSDILNIIDGGQALLITATASASSTSVETILSWYEI